MIQAKEILKEHVSKVVSLSSDQFQFFFSCFQHKSFKKGQAIITEGNKVENEYFVLNGCLKAYYVNNNSKKYILQFAMPTWWTSDYHALYNGEKAMIGVDCITDAEVLRISNANREKVCNEIRQVEYFFRWRTNNEYVALQKRLLSFMIYDTKHRYEEMLLQYPNLYNLVPKHLIAAYLGVSRETISRLYHSRIVK